MNIFRVLFTEPVHAIAHFCRSDNKPFGITDQLDWESDEQVITAYNCENGEEWYIEEDTITFIEDKFKFKVYNMADYFVEEEWEGQLFIASNLITEYKANLIMLGVPITNLPTP